MNIKTAMKCIIFLILIGILLNSICRVAIFSKYIDESAANLLSKNYEYYSWFYDVTEIGKGDVVVNYGMMGGIVQLGTLNLVDDTTIDIQTKKRNGEIKLLLVDESSEAVIFFDAILDRAEIEINKGSYNVFLVGSWFSGNCSLFFTNGSFNDY